MLRKMYESRELLKCVLGKMPNCLVYLSKRNPLILLLKYTPGVILGQNCVLLLDAVLNDSFFSKTYLIKSSVNML